MGDFKFDPKSWPDVPAMMANLTKTYGIDQVMVSTWPFIATGSDTFAEFGSKNWVYDLCCFLQRSVLSRNVVSRTRTDDIVAARFDTEGTSTPIFWDDNNCGDVGGPAKCYIYDPTQQAARQFYWQNLHKGYYQNGIKVFWLDASEPEISTSVSRPIISCSSLLRNGLCASNGPQRRSCRGGRTRAGLRWTTTAPWARARRRA